MWLPVCQLQNFSAGKDKLGEWNQKRLPSPNRNLAKRKRFEVRNALWSAWLRRPAFSALAETWRVTRSLLKNKPGRAGLIDAILGLPWIIPARNPVPATIDYQVKTAESAFLESVS
jgi:hypothetical protein